MSTPTEPAGPNPPPALAPENPTGVQRLKTFLRLLGGLLAMVLVAVGAAAAAWLVFEVRSGPQIAAVRARTDAAQQELTDRLTAVEQQQQALAAEVAAVRQAIAEVESAAREAALLVETDQGVSSLARRINELDELKAQLQRQEERLAANMTALEQTVEKRLGEQEQESAAALAAELRKRSLLQRAQDHLLKARIDLAEENRGLAQEELALAVRTLGEARTAARPSEQEAIGQLADLAEAARRALVTAAPDTRAQLDLLWQRLAGALVVP